MERRIPIRRQRPGARMLYYPRTRHVASLPGCAYHIAPARAQLWRRRQECFIICGRDMSRPYRDVRIILRRPGLSGGGGDKNALSSADATCRVPTGMCVSYCDGPGTAGAADRNPPFHRGGVAEFRERTWPGFCSHGVSQRRYSGM